MKPISVGFIGSGNWGSAFLRALQTSNQCHLTGVLTDDCDRLRYLDRIPIGTSVSVFSHTYDVVIGRSFGLILVAGWPFQIREEVLKRTRCPVVNVHASLLPKYRGPEPLLQQLLHEEGDGGVTLHLVEKRLDAGPICIQERFTIESGDDHRALFFKAVRCGKKALFRLLDDMGHSRVSWVPQDETSATYFSKFEPSKFTIDSHMSKRDVDRISRALRGLYPVMCNVSGVNLTVRSFELVDSPDHLHDVVRLKDGYLSILEY